MLRYFLQKETNYLHQTLILKGLQRRSLNGRVERKNLLWQTPTWLCQQDSGKIIGVRLFIFRTMLFHFQNHVIPFLEPCCSLFRTICYSIFRTIYYSIFRTICYSSFRTISYSMFGIFYSHCSAYIKLQVQVFNFQNHVIPFLEPYVIPFLGPYVIPFLEPCYSIFRSICYSIFRTIFYSIFRTICYSIFKTMLFPFQNHMLFYFQNHILFHVWYILFTLQCIYIKLQVQVFIFRTICYSIFKTMLFHFQNHIPIFSLVGLNIKKELSFLLTFKLCF